MLKYCLIINLVVWTFITEEVHAEESSNDSVTVKIYRDCILEERQHVFGALPGLGWDNLRGLDMGRVLDLDYSDCLLTEDQKFLIPLGFTVHPLKASSVDVSQSSFTHFENFAFSTASVASFGVDMYLTATFSDERETARQEQLNSQRELIQTTLRYSQYEVVAQTGIPLSNEFSNRVEELIMELMSAYDSLGNAPYADYLAECIVRDFGTHVTYAVQVGALLTQLSLGRTLKSLQKSASSKKDGNIVNFGTPPILQENTGYGFSINWGDSTNVANSKSDNKEEASYSSKLFTVGGIPYGPGFTTEKWQNTLDNELVVVDRRRYYLDSLITRDYFAHLPYEMVLEARQRLNRAILRYYQFNSQSGCLEINNNQFADTANLNDPTMCASPKLQRSIGGTFSSCTDPSICGDSEQNNPFTGDKSCPPGNKAIKLVESAQKCKDFCSAHMIYAASGWWIFGRRSKWDIWCKKRCATVETYWCAAAAGESENPSQPTFYFGGVFSKADYIPNLITKEFRCPELHSEYKFGLTATICLGKDEDYKKITFGGFFSCSVPNAYNKETYACPQGLIGHPAFLENNCEVSFCAKPIEIKSDFGLRNPLLPPFTKFDSYAMEQTFEERVIDFGEDNEWVNVNGTWSIQKLKKFTSVESNMEMEQSMLKRFMEQ